MLYSDSKANKCDSLWGKISKSVGVHVVGIVMEHLRVLCIIVLLDMLWTL